MNKRNKIFYITILFIYSKIYAIYNYAVISIKRCVTQKILSESLRRDVVLYTTNITITILMHQPLQVGAVNSCTSKKTPTNQQEMDGTVPA